MPHSADYILVVSDHEDHLNGFYHFAELVNRRLKSGYLLHGTPFHIGHVLYQTMIKPAALPNGQEQPSHEHLTRSLLNSTQSTSSVSKAHSTGKH